MKATIDQSSLIKCLGHVSRLVERRNSVPILSNALLGTQHGKLMIRATNMDSEITTTLPADVRDDGAITVPAHLLHDIVRKMPAGSQISIEQDGDVLIVKSGRSRFRLPTLPASEFPGLAMSDGVRFDLNGADFRRLFGKTAFAICTEEARYYLNGVYLHIAQVGDYKLRAVATDGHRLALVDADLPEGAEDMPFVIVPRKTVAEVGRLFEDAEIIAVEISASKIAFGAGDIRIVSKLIDGTFPDYGRVIPQNNDKVLIADKAALGGAVDRVAVVGGKESRAVKLSFGPGKVELSAQNQDSGSASDEVDGDYSADPIEIGFNSSYVQSILSEIDGERVSVRLADPASPTIFNDPDDSTSLFICMPMRC